MLERAAKLAADDLGTARSAALCWLQGRRPLQSALAWRRVTEIDPANGPAWLALGTAVAALQQRPPQCPEALACFEQAAILLPDHSEPHLAKAKYLARQNRMRSVVRAYREADQRIALDIPSRIDFANALLAMGDEQNSVRECDLALESDPDNQLLAANRLVALLNSPELSAAALAAEHRDWGRRVIAKLGAVNAPSGAWRQGQKIRVGYLISFEIGPLAPLFFHLLANHDREKFEVFIYFPVAAGSSAAAISRLADHARPLHSLDGAAWADAVRRDQIDIIVDRCGHFAGCPVDIHARRPAPRSVVLPGYPCTIGLPVACRITDRWADPPGMTEHLHEEPLVRLDRPFACYEPPRESPEVGPLPADRTGFVTFGLFHQRPKLNEKAALVWAEILRQTPNSRLLLHNVYGAEPPAPEEFDDPIVQTLVRNGVGIDRIQLVGRLPLLDHLALFNRIDIALDAFPRAGMTTTLESLWMGVPVITLAGEAHLGRVGVSFLTAVGLEELIGGDARDYAAKAMDLALDIPRLRMLRSELRPRMRSSALTDTAGFARAIEQIYQRLIEHAVVVAPGR